jgi:hypothetical protein
MDSAILSATSALAGSLIGGLSTLAASWLTLRGRVRAQALIQEAAKREALYAEFIIEASRRLTDAWAHHAENDSGERRDVMGNRGQSHVGFPFRLD